MSVKTSISVTPGPNLAAAEVELHATHDCEHLDLLRDQPGALASRTSHERTDEAAPWNFSRRDDFSAADGFRPACVVGQYRQIREKLAQFGA
jgi:hypothetical protein